MIYLPLYLFSPFLGFLTLVSARQFVRRV